MSQHLRDFNDPEAAPILQPELDPIQRGLMNHGETILNGMGVNVSDTSDGKRLVINAGGHMAGMDVHEPDVVIPALLRHGSNGLFYTYTGGADGKPLWTINSDFTAVPGDVNTGNPDSDGLVILAQALHSATERPRKVGRFAARLIAPFMDARAEQQWRMSTSRTKEEISRHYDHRQDFYVGEHGILDQKYTQYSSGLLLPGHEFESLEELQRHKVESIARKLELEGAETLLEIGTGWGGLAIALAEIAPHIKITSLTISEEQAKIARQRIKEAGLEDRIEVLCQDYRDLEPENKFDRAVSIEMIEAVDWRDLPVYFDALTRLVDPKDGVIMLQSINVAPEQEALQRRSNGFASTAIFPGGSLVSLQTISKGMAERGWRMHEATDLTRSYDLTLREWRRNMHTNTSALTDRWVEEGNSPEAVARSNRGFDFYLAFSQAGFRKGTDHIQDWQTSFRPGQ
ncbi:MAG TPA: cyclopropane-fatty-acyl-phospholipid synthase family protein [Candidatus Saccharimonadales bacterium]|nr:cyclopropane-fatty-acyl-phospholipid synthase family protein [Candidatus Saccharimonadales bacterium]